MSDQPGEDSRARFNIGPAECRKMALTSRYEKLSLSGEALTMAESDLRSTKMYETYRINKYAKQIEMEERRRLLVGEEQLRSEEEYRLALSYQQLRKKAMLAFQKESAAAQRAQQQMLESDNKLLIEREKNILLSKRREFENRYGGGGGAPLSTPGLLMTIDTGHGLTDQLEVGLDNDPLVLARSFCAKHALGENVVQVLARQIEEQIRIVKEKVSFTKKGKSPQGTPFKLQRGEEQVPVISTGSQRIIQRGQGGEGR